MRDAFKTREKTLEDQFFYQVDQKLLADLRAQLAREAREVALAQMTGWSDKELLGHLADLDVSPEAVAALSILPTVFVAWADGQLDEHERCVILAEACEKGIEPGSPGEAFLSHWLQVEPTDELRLAWQEYLHEVIGNLTRSARESLRREVMWKAQVVARASGGSFGVARISPSETKELERIDGEFSAS